MAIIGKIRKRGGLAVAIVAIAILAFIFSDLFTKGRSGDVPTKVASIDGIDINVTEFQERQKQLENQIRQQNPDATMDKETTFQTNLSAYQQLVSEKLLDRECSKLGITVGEDELNDMFLGTFIATTARQQFTDPATGQYSTQTVKQIMQQYEKMSPEQQQAWQQMKKSAVDERIQNKYGVLLAKSFYMPKAMAKYVSDTYDEVVDTRYAVLPFSSIDDSKIKLTDEDYKKYYDEHKNQFMRSEDGREIEFVKFDVLPSAADVQALNDSVNKLYTEMTTTSDADMESFVSVSSDSKYDSNYYAKDARNISALFPDSILAGKGAGSMIAPRQVGNNWVMGKIMNEMSRPDSVKFSILAVFNTKTGAEQIKRTPDQEKALVDSLYAVISKDVKLFEENVTKFSDDPQTKNKFGDMGWVMDGQLSEDMFAPMISCPVNGVFRYSRPDGAGEYIIKVTERTALKNKIKLAQVVMGIRPSDKTIAEVRDKANIFLSKSKDLAAMKAEAQKENLNVNTSAVSRMGYVLDGTPYAREIICWAFESKTSKGDVAPQVYELQNVNSFQDMFVVAGVKEVYEKGVIPLEQLKESPDFERLVKIEKKAEQLMAKADGYLKSAKTVDAFAAAAGVAVDTVAGVDFSSNYYGKAGAEMRVLGTLTAAKTTGLQKPIKGFNGIYVAQIDKIYKRAVKEDVNMIRQNYEMRMQQRMQQVSPIGVLYENAKIENNFTYFVK